LKQSRAAPRNTATMASTGQYSASEKSSSVRTLHKAAMPAIANSVPKARDSIVPSQRSSRSSGYPCRAMRVTWHGQGYDLA
jgi:hypothetical protein